MPTLREELEEWLRIPSVSTGGGDGEALRAACDWVLTRVEDAGGTAEAIAVDGGHPIATGLLEASRGGAGAPTVLAYGHYDVQDPGPPEAWQTPPFEPAEREGRLYARGAADDKGNFLPLLHVACELARGGELPVNVRFLVEGEEEIGSKSVLRHLEDGGSEADCAVVFDSLMADEHTPALSVGARGCVQTALEVRTGERDVHSGLYGGAVMNAAHVVVDMLRAVMPDGEGRVRPELAAGTAPVTELERESWSALVPGPQMIADAGSLEVTAGAGEAFYDRTGGAPAVDVNMAQVGEPRTIVPGSARAYVSLRLAPGQDAHAMAAEFERLLRDAAPAGAVVRIDSKVASPVLFDPTDRAIRLAAEGLGRACGAAPALVRLGGTLPLLAVLAGRGMPAIVSGFVLPDDAMHAPNESYRLESLRLGEAAAREIYRSLAELATT